MSDSIQFVDVILSLERSEDEKAWRKAAAKKLRVMPAAITDIRLQKHSIDARKSQIKVQLRLEVAIGGKLPAYVAPEPDYTPLTDGGKQVIIVGSGPAGMFAAHFC